MMSNEMEIQRPLPNRRYLASWQLLYLGITMRCGILLIFKNPKSTKVSKGAQSTTNAEEEFRLIKYNIKYLAKDLTKKQKTQKIELDQETLIFSAIINMHENLIYGGERFPSLIFA